MRLSSLAIERIRAMTESLSEAVATTDGMAADAAEAGLRRIHMIAWRDREDPTAGGSEEHASQVARHWAQAGLDVTLRTARVEGKPSETVRDGYRVVRRGGRFTVFPRTAAAGALGMMGPRDGLVEIFHGMPFFGPLWARGPRIAVVHHLHLDVWHILLPGGLAHVAEVLERQLAPPLYRSTPVVALSPSTKREVINSLRLQEKNITVAPGAVDRRFRPGGTRSAAPSVVAVARFMPQKGVDTLLRVLAEARHRVPVLEAVIVGEGPQRAQLEALARDLGGEDWIEFTGRVSDDELQRRYQEAWVLASASTREGWGLTITEAAACGTPAVATRIPGHVDAVEDGKTGLLASSAEDLADALVRVLTDEGLRTGLGRAALAHAAAHTWDRTAAGVLAALTADARARAGRGV